MTDAPSIQILVTPAFQGQLHKLAKQYRNQTHTSNVALLNNPHRLPRDRTIAADLQPLIENWHLTGDRIPGFAN
jgi:mRNA-degrading endonuclease RelE of RelBE toxin-antitoxin system